MDTLDPNEKNVWWKHSDSLEQVCNHMEIDIRDMSPTAPALKQATAELLVELDFLRQRLNAAITQVDTVIPSADPDPVEIEPAWRVVERLADEDNLDDIPF